MNSISSHFFEGYKPTIEGCLYHRCKDHYRVEQINSNEHSGSECGACIKAYYEGILSMTVARLGGTVEDAPTHRGNFLQRIDELRAIERGDSTRGHPPGKLGIPGCCFKD